MENLLKIKKLRWKLPNNDKFEAHQDLIPDQIRDWYVIYICSIFLDIENSAFNSSFDGMKLK